jgi:hypothetical protein
MTTWKWPQHQAVGTPHTVDTPHGRRAGFLVRTTGGAELGYIWPAGNAWLWRTPSGQNYGERSSQPAAVKVLRQAYDLAQMRAERLPFDDAPTAPQPPAPRRAPDRAPTAPSAPPRPGQGAHSPQRPQRRAPTAPQPPAPPAPAPPDQRIVWTDQAPDVTSRLATLLERTKK